MPSRTRRPQTDTQGNDTAARADSERRFSVSGVLNALSSMIISPAHADDVVSHDGGEQGGSMLDEAARQVEGSGLRRPDWGMSKENDNATDAVHDEIDRVEALLDEGRARLATQATSDASAAEDLRMQGILDREHERMNSVDMGNGVAAPVPYMINSSGNTWTSRKNSRARRLLGGRDADGNAIVPAEALQWAKLGKASAGQMRDVLQGIVANRMWEQLGPQETARFNAALSAILPPEASDDVRAAASALAYAEVAGLGTDCSGYVQHMLVHTGVLPAALANEISTMTSARTLTSGMGDAQHTDVRGTAAPSPLNANGSLNVRPGDTVKIDGGDHIGVVHDAIEVGDDVIIRYSHSTPNQTVNQGNTQIAATPEGVRMDIMSWNKTTQRWTSVRGAYTSNQLNGGLLDGFFRLDRSRVESYASGWMDTRDPWSVAPEHDKHALLDDGMRYA